MERRAQSAGSGGRSSSGTVTGRIRKDADGRATTFAYDCAGHLTSAANPDAILVRTVDLLGNVLTETVNGRTLTHTRDALGRRTGRTTPEGHTSTWTYDAAGRPTALATPGGTLGFKAWEEKDRPPVVSVLGLPAGDVRKQMTVSTRGHAA